MPATAYSYRCYTACIIGFQFVTRSSTRYRILYRRSAQGFHCRCFVIYYAFFI